MTTESFNPVLAAIKKPDSVGFFLFRQACLLFSRLSRSNWGSRSGFFRSFFSGFLLRFGLIFGGFDVFFRCLVHFILSFVHFLLSVLGMLRSVLGFVFAGFIASGKTQGSGEHNGKSKRFTHGVFLLVE
ncbi:conserved protein of unknown function [Pseudomonas sp. JV241A]|nr:conserved protein of unknown function [Pseudomonas sp. JV241A]